MILRTFTNLSAAGVRVTRVRPQGFWALFLSLFAFWLLVSQAFDLQHLVAGIACSLLVTYFWREFLLDIAERHDLLPSRFLLSARTFRYVVDLLSEIVKANWAIARIVLHPALPISPVLITVRTRVRRDLIRVVYANSITLTPGTISVRLDDDRLMVHALTREAATGVEGWKIEQDLLEIEGAIGGG